MTPIDASRVFETMNGTVQVAGQPGDSAIGLLVERDGHAVGTLIDAASLAKLTGALAALLPFPARQLAERLIALDQSADT
jgi:hypothetical protein